MIRTVTHLAKNVAGTAYTVARHPIGSAATAVGFAKGIVESGVGLVRHGSGEVPQQRAAEPEAPAEKPAAATPTAAPERDLPGPDIVLKAVPSIDELPEPVVIYADDDAATGTGEAFQTEPKATTRADTIGHEAGDVLEAQDEVIFPEEAEVEVETEVGTTGADFGTNPSTGDPDHTAS